MSAYAKVEEVERTYSSRMKLPTERPPQLMPPIMLPAMLLLSLCCLSRMEMGREWKEVPGTREPWRPLSLLKSLPRPSMLTGFEGAWRPLSVLWLLALAACSCVVRLEVWVGGDARGVVMSIGEAIATLNRSNVVGGVRVTALRLSLLSSASSASSSGRNIRSSRSKDDAARELLSRRELWIDVVCQDGWWRCSFCGHRGVGIWRLDGLEAGVLTGGLSASDSLLEGDEAREGVGGVVVAADESRMAVSGEIKSTGRRLGRQLRKGPGLGTSRRITARKGCF